LAYLTHIVKYVSPAKTPNFGIFKNVFCKYLKNRAPLLHFAWHTNSTEYPVAVLPKNWGVLNEIFPSEAPHFF